MVNGNLYIANGIEEGIICHGMGKAMHCKDVEQMGSSDKLGSILQFCLLTAVIYLLVVFVFDSGLLCYKLLLVILLLFLWL